MVELTTVFISTLTIRTKLMAITITFNENDYINKIPIKFNLLTS